MGNTSSIRKINCEDMQKACKNMNNYIIINTLDQSMQQCLILNTIKIENEEALINSIIKKSKNKNIIIYGRNCNDDNVYKKYQQLVSLGFTNVYVYVGGMFEWLLLQDVYGNDLFPTTSNELDILKYKSHRIFDVQYIQNG
uniref:Rhodanese domain-containing protein n=1 Tax=viral metagenome TaxID=1070528 RepID=A0A6C0EXQ8_9ZZZZ